MGRIVVRAQWHARHRWRVAGGGCGQPRTRVRQPVVSMRRGGSDTPLHCCPAFFTSASVVACQHREQTAMLDVVARYPRAVWYLIASTANRATFARPRGDAALVARAAGDGRARRGHPCDGCDRSQVLIPVVSRSLVAVRGDAGVASKPGAGIP